MAQLLTAADLAIQLQVNETTIRKWVMLKKIPYVKLSKALRFEQEKIDAWIAARSIKTRVVGVSY